MKFLRRTAAVILIALLCVCVFGGFVVPEDMDKSIVTIYSTDGRILQMRENDAQQYLNDGWTKNFKDVMTKVWKSDGSSKSILKGQTALYTNSGWSADKGDVTAIMTDKDGNEKEIFKDNIELYKEKGWKLKRENKQENNIESAVKAVALTFDDGPNPSTTNRLLDILKKYNVKATFFMLGERVSSGRECIKRMYDEGMEIGSHTYSHKQLTKLSYDNIKSEIDKTNKAIYDVIGENPTVIMNACFKGSVKVIVVVFNPVFSVPDIFKLRICGDDNFIRGCTVDITPFKTWRILLCDITILRCEWHHINVFRIIILVPGLRRRRRTYRGSYCRKNARSGQHRKTKCNTHSCL